MIKFSLIALFFMTIATFALAASSLPVPQVAGPGLPVANMALR